MENKKTILLHNITPEELKDMIITDLMVEVEKLIKQSNLPEFYSVSKVAKLLGLSNLTIYSYIKNGKIPATKIGRKIQIKRSDIDEALKEVKSLKYKR